MPTTNPNAPATQGDLSNLETRIDARFADLDVRFDAFEKKIEKLVDNAVTSLATTFHEAMIVMYEHVDDQGKKLSDRIDKLDARLTSVESSMVTKSYLDDKLSDFKGEVFERMDRQYVRRSELQAHALLR